GRGVPDPATGFGPRPALGRARGHAMGHFSTAVHRLPGARAPADVPRCYTSGIHRKCRPVLCVFSVFTFPAFACRQLQRHSRDIGVLPSCSRRVPLRVAKRCRAPAPDELGTVPRYVLERVSILSSGGPCPGGGCVQTGVFMPSISRPDRNWLCFAVEGTRKG